MRDFSARIIQLLRVLRLPKAGAATSLGLAVLLALVAGCAKVQPAPTGSAQSATYTVQSNVQYCTASDGTALDLDIYTPTSTAPAALKAPASPGRYPVVVYVHGGAWRSGDKSRITRGPADDVTLAKLTENGWMVMSINYRLDRKVTFPAQIEDVKCAVRSIRAHANAWHVDPNHVELWGSSAGGHLVALAGAAGPSAGWDVGEYLNNSSHPQSVIDWFGPSDLQREIDEAESKGNNPAALGVRAEFRPATTAELKAGSPITYVSPQTAPTLIMQGAEDTSIYPDQSQELYDALKADGVPTKLVMVQNAGHDFQQTGTQPIDPSPDQIAQIVLDWVNQYG